MKSRSTASEQLSATPLITDTQTNYSSLVFAACGNAEPLILTAAHQNVDLNP